MYELEILGGVVINEPVFLFSYHCLFVFTQIKFFFNEWDDVEV